MFLFYFQTVLKQVTIYFFYQLLENVISNYLSFKICTTNVIVKRNYSIRNFPFWHLSGLQRDFVTINQ